MKFLKALLLVPSLITCFILLITVGACFTIKVLVVGVIELLSDTMIEIGRRYSK